MAVRAVAPIAAAAACLSCQALFGVDEADRHQGGAGGEGAVDGSTSDASTGGGQGCALCIEPAPAGWFGPAYLYTTVPAATFTCPNLALATTYWQGEPPAAFECSACSCGAAAGVTCGQHPLSCYPSGCSGAPSWSGTADDCQYVGSFGACAVGDAPVTGGQCAPSGGVPSAATWQLAHHLCEAEASADGCADGACFSGPGDATPTEVCILSQAEGHLACPAGWDQPPLHVWASQSDTRACACSCSPAAGTCTGGGYGLSPAAFGCDVPAVTGPGQCKPMGGATYANWKSPESIEAGCSASAPVPSGAFVGVGPRTLCCRAW